GFDQLRCNHATDAVAAVDHHFQGFGQGDVVADLGEIARQDIDLLDTAQTLSQVLGIDAGFQRQDLFIGQGVAGNDDLEAVVIRRVVATGEHDSGGGRQYMGGEVKHRCGHHAQVRDLTAAIDQALDQRLRQQRAGQAPVAADGYARLPLGQAGPADGATDPVVAVGGQAVANHAADVISAKNARRQGRYARGRLGCDRRIDIVKVQVKYFRGLEQRVDQL